MAKLFCSQFFVAVSLACLSLESEFLGEECPPRVFDSSSWNRAINQYNQNQGACSSIEIDESFTLSGNSPSFTLPTDLANSILSIKALTPREGGSTPNYTITAPGYSILSTASSNVHIQLDPSIALSGGTVSIGPGSLQFNSSRNWQWITQVNLGNTGTIEFNASGTIASPFVLTGATNIQLSLVPSGLNSMTFSGVISGSGSLTLTGPGVIALSGINTFTGGVTLANNVSCFVSNGSLGSGTLNFNTGTSLTLDGPRVNTVVLTNPITLSGSNTISVASGTATLSGQISGSGLLTTGTGTLVLSGNSPSFSGGISIASGNLVVTNNIGTSASSPGPLTVASLASATSPDLSVTLTVTSTGIVDCSTLNNYGTITVDGEIVCVGTATLSGKVNGSGIIEANGAIVYGTVSAGNSPGVLTFIADTDFLPGSTVSVYIGPTQFAELVVIGDLTLGSDVTVEFRPLPGCYANGQRYEFLTVEGGDLAGTFANVDMGTLLLTPSVFYGDGGAVLTVNRTNLTTVATGNNALAVAGALQTKIASDSSPALCSATGKLILSSQEEISSIFSQMQPSLFKALVIAQENNAVKVRDTLSYRMQVVLDGAHCQTVFVKENSEPKNTCSNDQKPFHAWVDGMGDSLNQRSMYFAGSPQVGYNENMGGVVAGFDYHFAKYLYAGVLGAYTDSTLKWRESQGTGDIQSGYAGLYFSAVSNMFYGNASVIGSWNSFSAHRNINFPLEVVTAKNSHGGDQLLSHVDTGINLGWNGFTIRPFDSFDYITGTENSYTETGADALDLTVDKSNSIMLRNELGLNFAGCFCMPYGKWMLSPKISWVREVRVKGSEYTAEFEGTDLPFTVEGFFPDRSLVSPGVSLTGAFLEELLTIGLYYNGEFNGNYSDHSYGGQVRFGF